MAKVSVCHTLRFYQNDASYDHKIFTEVKDASCMSVKLFQKFQRVLMITMMMMMMITYPVYIQ